jgi:hypothetical protein
MENARVVIESEGKFVVISFYGVPVYMTADGLVTKHEGVGIRYIVFSPVGSTIYRADEKNDITAAELDADLDYFLSTMK